MCRCNILVTADAVNTQSALPEVSLSALKQLIKYTCTLGQFTPKISYCLAYTTCICAFVSVLVEINWLFVKRYCSYSI